MNPKKELLWGLCLINAGSRFNEGSVYRKRKMWLLGFNLQGLAD